MRANYDFTIQVIPAAPEAFFADSKLRPTGNSIRPKGTAEKLATRLPPSPFYNASLKTECNFESYLKILNSASKQSAGFKDSCILGRIWLRQRGFGSCLSKGGFGHFEWAVLTALLLKGGQTKGPNVLSTSYSSYQMFKGILQFLSSTNMITKPQSYEAPPDFQKLRSDVPMFYDGPRGQNILYKMTPWSYTLLWEESKTSLKMLNDITFDAFESTFILRKDQPLLAFDCLVRLPVPNETYEFSGDHETNVARFGRDIFDILKEGLTDRVKLIDIQINAPKSWSIKTFASPSPEQQSISVGVVFDPLNIDRLVDHGPSAEDKKQAAKFQKFWGGKAELRRFKDGSILESLVWSPGSSYSIFQDIFTYLVKLHYPADVSKGLRFIGSGFHKCLPSTGSSSKAFEALMQAFNTFEKDIRAMESLPLQLKQLSAISPQLRYASVQIPTFSPRQPLKKPSDVIIQFEGSGRWPDDVTAIQRTKIAFLLKIGSLLGKSGSGTTTRLGLENEGHPLRNGAFLDVTYESGACFRVRINNDREQTLLEHQINDRLIDNRAREDAVVALTSYKRMFIQLPLLTQSITTHCTRFPLLSASLRLMKQWFDCHMLLRHISEELVELLVARTFMQPYPWRVPSSAMSGFLRTLLFISRWDWRSDPLIVDFTGTMTSRDIASINLRMEAWRKIDPGMNRMVILAASNHDPSGTAYTGAGPSKMVAARMTALARSAWKVVKDQGTELDHRALLASSTTDYDFVIHLAPLFPPNDGRNVSNPKFKNLEVQGEANVELLGYEPVTEYLQELEKLYASSIVFFHSAASGPVIAGLWNPQTTSVRPFKVRVAHPTTPELVSGDEGDIKLDKAAVLTAIARIGGDMVSRIEIVH